MDSGCTTTSFRLASSISKLDKNKRVNYVLGTGRQRQTSGTGSCGFVKRVNFIPELNHDLFAMTDLLELGYNFEYIEDKLLINNHSLPFTDAISITRSADHLYWIPTDQFLGMCNLCYMHKSPKHHYMICLRN